MFKVGDKIRRISNGWSSAPIGFETEVVEPGMLDSDLVWYRGNTGSDLWGEARSWELITHTSPIRTETVIKRLIEPGVYGPLRVAGETLIPDCEQPDQPPLREVEAYLILSTLNASEWRELARVALELAEYLDAE